MLITNIQVEVIQTSFKWSSLYVFHALYITLTDKGYENIDEVLQAIFSYLLFLQESGPNENFYNDIKQIKYNEFLFTSNSEYNAAEISVDVMDYEPRDILKGPKLFNKYDENMLQSIYSRLNEGKFNIMIFTNKQTFDKVEEWMQIEYKEEGKTVKML